MKRFFTLFIAILGANTLLAQFSVIAPQPTSHSRVVNGLLQQQSADMNAAAKTTAGITLERIKAQSIRNNTINSLVDSINLGYGALRTSSFDYNNMIFAYNYPYNASPMFNYAGRFTKPQVLCDTFLHWTVNPNTLVYGYYETCYSGYDTANNLTSHKALYVDSPIYPNMIYSNCFTSANLIDTGYASKWVLGSADSAFKQFFTYNSSNKLVKDSMYERHLGVWRIVSRTFYTYDGSNNLTVIDYYANVTDTSFLLPLIKQQKYVNTYDGSNRLLTVLDSTFDGTNLAQNIKDTFEYTGSYAFHTAWRQHQWDAINSYWAPMMNMTKHLNGLGRPDTVHIQSFDSLMNAWVPQSRNIFHYNSFNDPDTMKNYEYNFTAFPSTPDFITKYYYQTYVNTVGKNDPVPSYAQILVLPNPASNTLIIRQKDLPQNTVVVITMLDMNGRIVIRERMAWQGDARISVSDLVPGIYNVVMQDEGGNILGRQAVEKK